MREVLYSVYPAKPIIKRWGKKVSVYVLPKLSLLFTVFSYIGCQSLSASFSWEKITRKSKEQCDEKSIVGFLVDTRFWARLGFFFSAGLHSRRGEDERGMNNFFVMSNYSSICCFDTISLWVKEASPGNTLPALLASMPSKVIVNAFSSFCNGSQNFETFFSLLLFILKTMLDEWLQNNINRSHSREFLRRTKS